ncbi:hypothetical protein BSKO_13323 [Bryopsis sp. KO-2023]|nr:hypothetical protein BSKO_13323 [Bryopsis sp. KO-2023]
MYHPGGPSSSTSPPILPSGEFTWVVENFSQQDKKLYSKSFIVGTREWRLLLFPEGNPSAGGSESVALYLDYPEAGITPPNLCPKARFELVAVNKEKPGSNIVREASHKFTESANDWGFTQFVAIRELPKGFVVDDTFTVKVRIALEEDRFRRAREARQATGCVGVRCKMEPFNLEAWSSGLSALVQCLYHLPIFRKAVYQLPEFSVSGPEHAFSRELRKVFFHLQYSSVCVMCDNLSRAAGCPDNIADIVELAGDLVSKLRGTGADEIHNELFVGQCRNYIEAADPDINHRTSEKEQFVDLSLEVEGCRNIYESLLTSCKVEELEGANQIHVEGHGLVDGRRYTRLERLPPVLRLQPKRFTYDSESSSIVKTNGQFQFYPTIDLEAHMKDLMVEGATPSTTMRYLLHSVVVHLGTPLEGSYCVYVRKTLGGNWVQLDEDSVVEVTEEEAINRNYGSDTAADASAVSTAVVLVYIREDEWDRVVCKVDKSEIPENIRHELEDELAEVSKAMAGPAEGHLYVDVNVITEEDLERASLDLHCLEVMAPDRKVFSYRMHKHESIGDVRRKLCRDLGISQDAHKLWLWSKRQNLMRLSLKAPPESRLLDIKTHRDTSGHPANNKNVLMTIPLYLQEPDLLSKNDESILLFFKFFDPSKGTLEFLGERSIPRHSPLDLFWDDLCQMAGLAEGVEIDLYEDSKSGNSVTDWPKLEKHLSPHRLRLQDGDVVYIQQSGIWKNMEDQADVSLGTLPAYMLYWASRVKLNCRPFHDREDPGFELDVLMRSPYETVCSEIALYIGLEDWRMLRVHVVDASGVPNAFKYSLDNMNLKTGMNWRTVVLYEIMDVPLPMWERQQGI